MDIFHKNHETIRRSATELAEATIVFTVHNRRDLLLEAVRLAKRQSVAVEIIVMDDASTDGVGEALAELHPDVHYERSETSRGPCYQRNRGIALATCDIVFPLDDDSWLVSDRTVAQTLEQFGDPSIAVIALPFRNALVEDIVHQRRLPDEPRRLVASYVACAFAVRKAVFLEHGRFDELYFYMVEEADSSIRLLQAGYPIEVGIADPIDHMQPPRRKSMRADYYGRRNRLLFLYGCAPSLSGPLYTAAAMAKNLVIGVRDRHFRLAMQANRDALRLCRSGEAKRLPVDHKVFRTFRLLESEASLPLSAVMNRLRG